MLVSEGDAATGNILIWVASAATRAMSRSKLLLRFMFGSVVLLQLGSVLMSMA